MLQLIWLCYLYHYFLYNDKCDKNIKSNLPISGQVDKIETENNFFSLCIYVIYDSSEIE